jgi:SNF2 family DNA or RNA helicase
MQITVSRASPGSRLLTAKFAYDEALVAAVKSIPGRTWNAANKVWVFPGSPENIAALRKAMPSNAKLLVETSLLQELEAEKAGVELAHQVRTAGDSDIAFPYLTEPYAHQRAGLAFLAHMGSGALLWEMGLGKTKTAIDYAEWLASRGDGVLGRGFDQRVGQRVLVITPNSVKRNWGREIEKHAGHKDFVIPTGTLAKRLALFGTKRYTIVNCEQLSFKPSAEALKAIAWDLVIVDESTRFKTPGAARTKALHRLNTKRRIILTGTPITGKPEDAWSQMEFISPGVFGTFYSFRDRYLELDYFKKPTGVRPNMAQDLADRIARRSYRILKTEVIDLPPKVYTDRTVELSGDQAKAYQQMRDDLWVEIGESKFTANNILTVLLRLTQITAGQIGTTLDGYRWLEDNAKVKELDDLLNDELRGERVVIFGQYQFELEQLAKRYVGGSIPGPSLSPLPIIYGPTPEPVRDQLVNEFQVGDRRLLFCQNRTGGIGINLTAAQTAIYYTRSWSLEEYLQSQDRLHRIGQRGTVNILHLVAEGTIDEEIAKALAAKQNIADYLTGDAARELAARLLKG